MMECHIALQLQRKDNLPLLKQLQQLRILSAVVNINMDPTGLPSFSDGIISGGAHDACVLEEEEETGEAEVFGFLCFCFALPPTWRGRADGRG